MKTLALMIGCLIVLIYIKIDEWNRKRKLDKKYKQWKEDVAKQEPLANRPTGIVSIDIQTAKKTLN